MRRNALPVPGRMRYFTPLITFVLILIISACKKEDVDPFDKEDYTTSEAKDKCGNNSIGSSPVVNVDPCGSETTVNLIAGQNIDIGFVEIANTDDSLYITITAEGSWWILAAHVYIGALNAIPQTSNGNPKVGHFPYQDEFNSLMKTVQFRVPLAGLPPCYIAAVHVEAKKKVNGQIVQSETAWAQGDALPGPNWAMYVPYCTQQCAPCTYGSLYTVMYNTQNVNIGEIQITNNADSVFVTVHLIPNWFFRKIYVYVGTYATMPNTPQSIPNPNQFPITMPTGPTLQSITVGYPIAGFPSCYTVAVHADVVNTVNGLTVQTDKGWGYGTPFTPTTQWGWTIPYCTRECEQE